MTLEPLTRFLEHMPKDGAEEIMLLKGHLLLEEQLTELIYRAAKHPRFLPKLRFADKIGLARANSSSVDNDWVWVSLKKLNAARNELSHTLDIETFKVKLAEFIAWSDQYDEAKHPDLVDVRFTRLFWSIFSIYCILSAEANFDPSKLKIRTLLSVDE